MKSGYRALAERMKELEPVYGRACDLRVLIAGGVLILIVGGLVWTLL